MTDTDRPTFASTSADKFAVPQPPGWRRPLILTIAGWCAVLSAVTIDLARGVGWREAVLIGLTLVMIGIGVRARSTRWSVGALVCAVAAGALGFHVQADSDLDGLYVGLGGMAQVGVGWVILVMAAVLAALELVHARGTRRG